MKVLVSTWVFPTHGGVFAFLSLLVPRLLSRGHVVDVVAVRPSPTSMREFHHLSAKRIHLLSQLPLPSPFSFPLLQFAFRQVRVGRMVRPDLVFCQDPFYSGLPSLLAASVLGLPLGLGDHGMITNFARGDYWRNFGFRAVGFWRTLSFLVMKLVVSRSSFIYSPGEDVTERISELFGKVAARKTFTVPIAVDTETFRPSPEARRRTRDELGLGDGIVAISVGRLHVESGMDYLINAAALLPLEKRPRFLVVGDGALRERYESLAADHASGCFTFIGYREDIPQLLNAADLFIFPKIFAGGHSVALREAMATGLASIATAGVDSHDRIISEGETGMLIPPGDAAALASAMLDLLTDVKARRRMGTLARASVERSYGLEPFAEAVENLLESVMAE